MLNSSHGVFSKFEFRVIELLEYIGSIWFRRFGSCKQDLTRLVSSVSSTYTKLEAPSGWDCFNTKFPLQSDFKVCVHVQ